MEGKFHSLRVGVVTDLENEKLSFPSDTDNQYFTTQSCGFSLLVNVQYFKVRGLIILKLASLRTDKRLFVAGRDSSWVKTAFSLFWKSLIKMLQ